LLARTIDLTDEDIETYRKYVDVAVEGHTDLKCAITPKVHLMLRHIKWQMKNIRGGIGDKMEDWVERMHQDGIHERRCFWIVKNPKIRAIAREKVHVQDTHADVIAFANELTEGNKRNLSEPKVDTILVKRKMQHNVGWENSITYFIEMEGKELTWLSKLFDNAKGGGMDCKGDNAKIAPADCSVNGSRIGISPSISAKPSAAGIARDV
jgi:hypothetical protein